jgi:hypothetical protein
MLTGNELYIVIKLVSGENVMAVLKSEDEDFIEVESPMCIRTIPVLETGREHITASPLCQFAEDSSSYVLDKKNLMFVKKMHHLFIPHYRKIVADHEEVGLNIEPRIRKNNKVMEESRPAEEDFLFVIEGNDTIN